MASLTLGGCSEASPRLSAWPNLGQESDTAEPSRSGAAKGVETETGEQTKEESEDKDRDSGGDSGSPESSSAGDTDGTSDGTSDRTSDRTSDGTSDGTSDDNQESGTSEPEGTQDSGDSTSKGESTEPSACEQELCLELNGEGTPDRSRWRHAHHTFPISLPKESRRLSRIELVEGFSKGTTNVELRSAMSSRSQVLAKFSWEFDLEDAHEWTGINLEEPVELPAKTVIWVEVTPVEGSIASVAARGQEVSLWYRPLGSNRWTKTPAPVMFRAYCCKEP